MVHHAAASKLAAVLFLSEAAFCVGVDSEEVCV